MRIGLLAGEQSGDQLGGGLMREIRAIRGEVQFDGVGGADMSAEGLSLLASPDPLAVMGLAEVLRHMPSLWQLRSRLGQHWLAHPPDVFVGIDAPDFNFSLERRLRGSGIPVAHYVSPSVWAWRQYRLKKICRSTNLMLVLFPFEQEFYQRAGLPVRYVGHPAATAIKPGRDTGSLKAGMGLPEDAPLIALLPGSRHSEVERLIAPFLGAAQRCWRQEPALRFVLPVANERVAPLVQNALKQHPGLPVSVLAGRAADAIDAADVVLVASGTAALECLFFHKPMVVAYRLAPSTYWFVKRMLKTPWYSLPNMLAGEMLVPEITQDDVTESRLEQELMSLLKDSARCMDLKQRFASIHASLALPSSRLAAEAVLELVNERSG